MLYLRIFVFYLLGDGVFYYHYRKVPDRKGRQGTPSILKVYVKGYHGGSGPPQDERDKDSFDNTIQPTVIHYNSMEFISSQDPSGS